MLMIKVINYLKNLLQSKSRIIEVWWYIWTDDLELQIIFAHVLLVRPEDGVLLELSDYPQYVLLMPRGCRGERHADVKQVVGDLLDEDWRDWFDELVACDDGTLLLGYVWLLGVDPLQLGGTRGAGLIALILIPVGASSRVSKCGVAESVEHPI